MARFQKKEVITISILKAMYDSMYGTEFENATGDKVTLPPAGGVAPAVSKESWFTGLVNHVKENKWVYYGVLAVGAYVVYKKFFAKK